LPFEQGRILANRSKGRDRECDRYRVFESEEPPAAAQKERNLLNHSQPHPVHCLNDQHIHYIFNHECQSVDLQNMKPSCFPISVKTLLILRQKFSKYIKKIILKDEPNHIQSR
jgi:hypothetical protein